MPCRFIRLLGSSVGCLAAMTLVVALSFPARGDEGITVAIGHSVGNPGQTVEVPVDLTTGVYAPTTMILWIGYDDAQLTPVDDYFETILRDSQGDPVLDNEGHVITSRSGVRPDFSLEDTGKVLSVAYHPEAGAIAISIVGLGAVQTAIPEGALLTLAFRIDSGLSVGPELVVVGHDSDNPVVVEEADRRSSASDAGGSIVLDLRDGAVRVGCSAPNLPANVAASQGQADGVLVAWDAVDFTSTAQYRVYRAATDDAGAASPLGEGWQMETTFLDITAEASSSATPGGCNGTPVTGGPTYYYWVASRSTFGCEQPPAGAGASGFRADGKDLAVAGPGGLWEQACLLVLLVCALAVSAWLRRRKQDA